MGKFVTIVLACALVLSTSCGSNKAEREKVKQAYTESLKDSIKNVEQEIESDEHRLSALDNNIGGMLHNFVPVQNSREVEGYMIVDGWQDRYPLSTTGLVARMTVNQQLELIATLKGKTFDRIEVRTPEETLASETVPYDQALNYRRDGLTTVMFSGTRADSIARIIAENELNQVQVIYLEGDGTRGEWTIPQDFKKMITTTSLFASARREQIMLEAKVRMLHEKIKLLRAHIDRDSVR